MAIKLTQAQRELLEHVAKNANHINGRELVKSTVYNELAELGYIRFFPLRITKAGVTALESAVDKERIAELEAENRYLQASNLNDLTIINAMVQRVKELEGIILESRRKIQITYGVLPYLNQPLRDEQRRSLIGQLSDLLDTIELHGYVMESKINESNEVQS